jgi:hypothetical protein
MKIIDILFDENLSDDKKIELIENTLQIDFNDITDDLLDQVRQEFKIFKTSRLKSSNVKRMKYNNRTQTMTIEFNGGGIYEYYKITYTTYLNVKNGNAVCRTTGQNKYGKWKVGKTPSNGSAVWSYLRGASSFPIPRYRKVTSY